MNLLDAIILVAALSAAVGGWRLGFLARVASWIGLAIGLYLGARFVPGALAALDGPDPASKLLIAAAVLVGAAFVGQALGLVAGSHLLRFVPLGPLRLVDRSIGSVVGVLGVLVAVWLLLPSMADVPGELARQARSSRVARFVSDAAPEPPDTLQALRRLVGEHNFPRVFEALRPAPVTGPPPATTGIPPGVIAQVSASTVKVSGEACSRIQEGSGFAAAPDTVVTNAHVVAGERSTRVLRPDGRRLDATVVLFDPNRDLAILRVPGLNQAPLPVSSARSGSRGAVFGHPGGQDPLRIAPAQVSQRVSAIGRDIYDSRTTRRDVLILASDLRGGDSGAPLVNASGAVVGVAFAVAPDRPGTAYALSDDELRSALSAPRGGAVSTGPCLRR